MKIQTCGIVMAGISLTVKKLRPLFIGFKKKEIG